VAKTSAEHIGKKAEQAHFQFEGQTLEAVTLSLGVAVFLEHGSTSAAILKAVDGALYRAKREGRDRVVVAGWKSKP
jgi:diguanylate cyclase (GGDEF)-like protein